MHIHTYPDPILKVECSPVAVINGDTQTLIENMSEIMYKNNGIGLAAPQVGIPMRIIMFDVDKKGLTVVINPIITLNKEEFISIESCLSVPWFDGKIRRKQLVHLEGIDRYEKPISIEAEGLLSACIQHEVDHLQGILLLDKASRMKKETYIRKLRKYHKKAK
jgi:peptide deformylase